MPGIPENITIAGRTPATIKGNLPPLIDTAPAARGGYRAGDDSGGGDSPYNPVGVIFSDNFDNQPDFTPTDGKNSFYASAGDTLPIGWDAGYLNSQWNPESGYPDNHYSLEITSANSDKARGGIGKSAVHWRESYDPGWNRWNSESALYKIFEEDYSELYVEFYIRFSENWHQRNNILDPDSFTSKLFRIGHWNREDDIFNGALDGVGPVFFWQYKRDAYGAMNVHAYRGGPPGTGNYYEPNGYTRSRSMLYSSHGSLDRTLGQEVGGTDPMHVDKLNGGPLNESTVPQSPDGRPLHEHVFGPSEEWTKIAFYVKINSGPGIADGILRQWLDGHRIENRMDIPWIGSNNGNESMVGWNYFAIGGNDWLQAYPNEDRFEDWYAIDDVIVRDELPENLQ